MRKSARIERNTAQIQTQVGYKRVNSLVYFPYEGFYAIARVDAIGRQKITVEFFMGSSDQKWPKVTVSHEKFLSSIWTPKLKKALPLYPQYSSGRVQRFEASLELAAIGKAADVDFSRGGSRSWVDLELTSALMQVGERNNVTLKQKHET